MFRQAEIFFAMEMKYTDNQKEAHFIFDVDPRSTELSSIVDHLGEGHQVKHVTNMPEIFK